MINKNNTKIRFARKNFIFFSLWVECIFLFAMVLLSLLMLKKHQGGANLSIYVAVLAVLLIFTINVICFIKAYGNIRKAKKTTDAENQKIKQELQEHKGRAQAFAEATQEGIVISDEGKVIEANQQFLNILGFENLSEIIGKSIQEDFTPPESHDIINEHIRKNSPEPYEAKSYRKDKSVFPISIHGHSILYKGKKCG
jgi:PAS domain S-box-containing protein